MGLLDRTVRIWNMTQRGEKGKIDQPQIPTCMSFSPDGKLLAVGAVMEGIRLYKVDALKDFVAIPETSGCFLEPLAFVPNSTCIAVPTFKKKQPKELWEPNMPAHRVRLWDYSRQKTVWESDLLQIPMAISASHDGRLVAAAVREPQPAIWIWSAKTGNVLKVFHGHEEGVTALAFSPDDTRLASAGADATLLIWDVAKLHK